MTGRVAAGASAPDVSGAAGVLAVGMAAPEGADLRFFGCRGIGIPGCRGAPSGPAGAQRHTRLG